MFSTRRRALIAGAGGVFALTAVLLVAPGFMDWTPYRDSFAAQLSRTTGRTVSIDGDVSFAILPRPALTASSVRVAHPANDDVIEIGRLRAGLAFTPLLRGALQFREIVLEDAIGTLTRDATPLSAAPQAPSEQGEAPGAQYTFQLHIEGVEVVNGEFFVRDTAGATIVHLADMDMRGRVEGKDTYTVMGALTADDIPLAIDLRLGSGGASGLRGGTLTARLVGVDASIVMTGRVGIAQRTFDGDVSVSGAQAHSALARLGMVVTERPAFMKPFSAAAKMSADATGVALNGLTVDAGGTVAKGAAEWRVSRTPQLTATFDFAPFTVEDWFAPVVVAPPAAAPPSAPAPAVADAANLSAQFTLNFPALSFRGQALRDGRVTAALADNELKISDVTFTLPGTTRVNGFGLVNIAADTPTLDGVVTLQTFDARGLFSWLGADVASVPPGRLGSASFQGALQGTLNFMELNDIEASVDTARIGGRLSFAPRARPFVGVDLRVQNLNWDSYRGTAPIPAAAVTPPPSKPDVYGVTPTGAPYAGLGAFDAEVHVQVDGLTAGGRPGGRVGLDLGLKDGTLQIRTASFENVAGATAWLSGSVGGLGTALQFDNLQFDLAGDDMARLADLVGVDLVPALRVLPGASLTGTLNGGAMQADLNATLNAADLTARVTGQLMDLDTSGRFNGQIEASHPRVADLMRATPHGWPANMRDPGALTFSAKVAQEPAKTTISEMRLSIGRDKVSGAAEISEVDGRTHVTASLTDIAFDLDRVLPADTTATTVAAAKPRAGAPAAPAAASTVWSQDEVTWSFLKGWSGEISVAGSAFTARGVAVQDFSGRLVVTDDAMELADWQGKVFGAPGQLAFRIAASPVPSLQGQLSVTRADFRAVVNAINSGRSTLKSGGTADLALGFSTSGTSVAGLIGALSGTGTLNVSAIETGGGLSAGLFGPLSAAAQLDVSTPGKPSPITLAARLTAANGMIKLESADVSSRSHTGRFGGVINLSRRQMDVTGELTPRKPGEDRLPIAIRGAMERPNIRLLPPS